MDMIIVNFKIVFLIVFNITCWFTLAMRQFQCVPTTYIPSINEFYTINFFHKLCLLFQ